MSTSTTHWETLWKIVAFQLPGRPEKVVPEARFVDLGADDLDMVEIQIAAEEAFSVDLTDLEKCVTVGDALALVEKACKAAPCREA